MLGLIFSGLLATLRRYQKLVSQYRARRDLKWPHEEDLDLLRGYQAFGERWPLIKIFFLPHRKPLQIRLRYDFGQCS